MNKEKINELINYIQNNLDSIESVVVFEKGKFKKGDTVSISDKYNIEVKEKEYKIVVA